MSVHGVGSREYFEKRTKELLAIGAIGTKGEAIATEVKEEELTCNSLLVLIGKAFREFVEFFSEGRYKKKLDKKIKSLKDPKYDDYNIKIDTFYNKLIENLSLKAFKKFQAGLTTFYKISNDLLRSEDFEQAYPALYKQLTIACGDKMSACKALAELPELLDSIVIDNPATSFETQFLLLKAEFEITSETKLFLNKYLIDIQKGLNLKKSAAKASHLYKFLDSKNAYLASLLPIIEIWKIQMKRERTEFLKALPSATNDLLFYSFASKQIRRIKKIVKLQRKEIQTEDKLKQSLVHFVADNLSEKVKLDKNLMVFSKKGLFDKFEKRKVYLINEKASTQEKLHKATQLNQPKNVDDAKKRIVEIESSQNFNNNCLDIIEGCFQSWAASLEKTIVSNEKKLNKLILKDKNFEKFAKLNYKINRYAEEAQDAVDAMLAEAAYRVFYKQVENKADPQPLPEKATPAQVKALVDLANQYVDTIDELYNTHFIPLEKKKLASERHDPHWIERVDQILADILPQLKILQQRYKDMLQKVDATSRQA